MEYQPRATVASTDPILRAYLEAAEWADLSEEDGEAMKAALIDPRWSPMSEADAARDIAMFRKSVGPLWDALVKAMSDDPRWPAEERIGHDIWLTRQRHGAGFWDRNLPKDIDEAATKAAHALGEAYVTYDGDANMLGIVR